MLNGVFQGLCFARIVGRAGVRRTFMFSMGCFMVVFALFPVINNLARASGVGAKVWVTIVLQLCFWCLMDMSYGPSNVSLTSHSDRSYPTFLRLCLHVHHLGISLETFAGIRQRHGAAYR
jgi:hypothetical protein